MNHTSEPQQQPPARPIIYIIIGTQSLLAIGCVGSLCVSLFVKVYSDPATLAAMILLTGTLVGNLGSILGGPRAMMVNKTEIVNTAAEPVNVATAPPAPAIKP